MNPSVLGKRQELVCWPVLEGLSEEVRCKPILEGDRWIWSHRWDATEWAGASLGFIVLSELLESGKRKEE